MMGMAALALAGCTNEEVLNVSDGLAIGFDAFVGNMTKSVTEVKTLTDFYVFGKLGADETSWNGQIFNNEPNTAVYYWQQGKHYRFGAYADGNGGQIADARYNAATQELTFPQYTPNDARDLVAATAVADASQAIPSAPVPLSFSHMLSQVGFTFNTEVGKEYTLAIRNIRINKAIRTATGSYKAPATIDWQGKAEPTVAYTYDDIADLAGEETNQASQFKLVIPQQLPTEEASKITVSFTASISGGGMAEAAEKSFELVLASPGEGGWKPGFRYNYTATINGDNITNVKPVEFIPSVGEWDNISGGTLTPPKIVSSYIRPNFYETGRVYTESMNACTDLIFMTASPYANGDFSFRADGEYLAVTFDDAPGVLQLAVYPRNASGSGYVNHVYIYEGTDDGHFSETPIADLDQEFMQNAATYNNTPPIPLSEETRAVKIVYAKTKGNVGINNLIITRRKTATRSPLIAGQPSLQVRCADGVLHVSGLEADGRVRVYTLAGDLVAEAACPAGDASLPFAPKGMFLVKSGDVVCKFVSR